MNDRPRTENTSTADSTGRAPILVVHPSSDLYGADRMLLEAVRELVVVHGDVVVAVPGPGPLVPLLLEAGARVEHVSTLVLEKRFLDPRHWPALVHDTLAGIGPARRMLRRLRPRAVYVSTEVLPLWPLLSRRAGAYSVVHVHEAELEMPGFIRLGLALPVMPANRALVNSECTLGGLVDSVPRLARKSTVVLNGVAAPPGGPRPARERLDGELRILYVGRLSERKGVHLLVEALRLLEERGVPAVLDLVGDVVPGKEWYEHSLRRLIAEAGVTDRVRFRGFHADVWPWMEAADVVVVPPVVTEAFGNTAVEAVLAARPVVVADHTGLREAVRDYGCVVGVDTLAHDAVWQLADAFEQVRADWPRLRAAALADAEEARVRHEPRVFGRKVAQAVAEPWPEAPSVPPARGHAAKEIPA
ncbi:glycosyltransferase [Kocuria sp. M1R5S2]|uniref:glycosyltransferase n=1 Tax=Kocuria rhizosphaerae TaxID=3376285 RepID=UPI00378C129B